jgi:hypothetical protein
VLSDRFTTQPDLPSELLARPEQVILVKPEILHFLE